MICQKCFNKSKELTKFTGLMLCRKCLNPSEEITLERWIDSRVISSNLGDAQTYADPYFGGYYMLKKIRERMNELGMIDKQDWFVVERRKRAK